MAQAPVTPKPFKLDAGDVVLDFVNTLDDRFSPEGPKELLTSYNDVLRFAQQTKLLSQKQAQGLLRAAKTETAWQSVLELREILARIFYSYLAHQSPSLRDLVRLSEHCKEAGEHRRLCSVNSSFVWQWADLGRDPQAPVWVLAQHASDLLTSERLTVVRSCSAEHCRWLFLDTSKNHTRRWCDMKTCGNRMKARRFHARQAIVEENS
ncbi:MAG: CGNR zinc finger domain-containing protein [Acidobacteriaceae bacterium]|nr:CGNR zinc finger domain-containing protein [Acidobacteriaceae bacterium]